MSYILPRFPLACIRPRAELTGIGASFVVFLHEHFAHFHSEHLLNVIQINVDIMPEINNMIKYTYLVVNRLR